MVPAALKSPSWTGSLQFLSLSQTTTCPYTSCLHLSFSGLQIRITKHFDLWLLLQRVTHSSIGDGVQRQTGTWTHGPEGGCVCVCVCLCHQGSSCQMNASWMQSLPYNVLLSMSPYQVDREHKHHWVFLAKYIFIKPVTMFIVWYRYTCDGLSPALVPSPSGKRYHRCHTSAGRLKCAKPQIKSSSSEVKFQNVLHYYKFKGKQIDGCPKPMQNKVNKQWSKISIWSFMEIFSNISNIPSLFSPAFSIYSAINLLFMILPIMTEVVFKSWPLWLLRLQV